MTAADALKKSEDFCRHVLRQASTNFALPFKTLPKRKRSAFEVIYAFMRLVDDASDDENSENRERRMAEWRQHLRSAYSGDLGGHAILPALAAVIAEFKLPQKLLEELIDGTAMDLTIRRYRTFEELYRYCYLVAGVVGLVSVRIFGLKTPGVDAQNRADAVQNRADALAEACGLAFQITNILRDVGEDAERGRIYLPSEDLERFGVPESDLLERRFSEPFKSLMIFEAERAEEFYRTSDALMDMLEPDARPCLLLMRGVYHGILDRVREIGYDVFAHRARVTTIKKLGIAARAYLKRFQG